MEMGASVIAPLSPARLPLMYSRKLRDHFALKTLGCGAYEREIKELSIPCTFWVRAILGKQLGDYFIGTLGVFPFLDNPS